MNKDQSTRERIIEATMDLVKDKGLRGATTRLIAKKANVNEITLFRQFGNKQGIMEAVIDNYSFATTLSDALEKVTFDIDKDMKFIAEEYQKQLDNNKDILLISYKEAASFPELNEMISRAPIKFKKDLMSYFKQMIHQGKLNNFDPEAAVSNFIFINGGYFLLKSRFASDVGNISLNEFLNKNISLFVQSIS